MIDKLFQPGIMSYPIITNPHLTKTVERRIVKTYARQRRGINKIRRRVYHLPSRIEPSTDIYIISGVFVCHSVVEQSIRRMMEMIK